MSDTGFISVNVEQSELDANQVNSAAAFLTADSLSPSDNDTTIAANKKLHTAFQDAQNLIASLGTAMDKEAENIRSIGAVFDEYDNLLADLAN